DQVREVDVEGGLSRFKKINPNTGINDNHKRLRRSSSRSPSHFTLPRSSRISFRFAPFKRSVRARWTSSRLDLQLNILRPCRTSRSSRSILVLLIDSPLEVRLFAVGV